MGSRCAKNAGRSEVDFKEKAKQNMILKIRVGSHLFGTSTPDSDEDFVGIFMPFDETVYGFRKCDEVDLGVVDKDDTGRNTKDAIDFKLHEYRKFFRLALENNPNILHALFVNKENILFQDDCGFAENLLERAEEFIHKGAYRRFVGYAHAQQHKMKIKPQNYADLESGLEILQGFSDQLVMADVVRSIGSLENGPFKDMGNGKHIKCGDINFERGVFVKKARKMIQGRLDNATNRHVLFTKYGFDVKFASNLIHLLMSGRELMETGRIVFPLTYAKDVLDVKQGKYTPEEIEKWADDLLEDARQAYEKTTLPSGPGSALEQFAINEVRSWMRM